MLGHDPSFPFVKKTFQRYAEKTGADLIITRKPHYKVVKNTFMNRALVAFYEKFYLFELLKTYERVLYIDADILITPNAPDVFKTFPDDKLYLLEEGALTDHSNSIDYMVKHFPNDLGNWGAENEVKHYYNAGVMLWSCTYSLSGYFDLSFLKNNFSKIPFHDQTYLSYLINRYQYPVEHLDKKFNYMNLFPAEGRFDAYFIHYAGWAFGKKKSTRYRTIIKDYFVFYRPKSPFNPLILFLADVKKYLFRLKRLSFEFFELITLSKKRKH